MSNDPFDESGGGLFETALDDIGLDGSGTDESGPRITLRCGPLELETEGRPDDTLADVQAAHLGVVETTLASAFEMIRAAWHRFWMGP